MTTKKSREYRQLQRLALLYLAAGWLIVQTVMSLTPVLDWPPIFGFGILFMLVMGCPIVLLMFWIYQVTHRTRSREKENKEMQDENGQSKGFQVALSILAGLALLVLLLDIFVLVDRVPDDQRTSPASQTQ